MNDILLPACEKFYANLVTGEGEISITAVHNLVSRVRKAGKPTRRNTKQVNSVRRLPDCL